MSKRSSIGVAIAGVALASLGGMLVLAYGRSVKANATEGPTAPVFVFSRGVASGTKWEDAQNSLKKQLIPVAARPATVVTDLNRLSGRTAVRSISKGEIATATQFGAEAISSGLEIPRGHNAISFNLQVPQAVARFVQPGSLTNVFATLKDSAVVPGVPAGGSRTKMILSNVQVLANQPSQPPGEKAAGGGVAGGGGEGEVILTLALSPVDAERLIAARESGTLWFGLVRPGDRPATTPGANGQMVLR